jgi:hypothetical protein
LPAAKQVGGDVIGVRAGALEVDEFGAETLTSSPFHIGGIMTGDGGFGARGGSISGVNISGDIGGLILQTGNGGDGEIGGNGGSITGLSITDSVNSRVIIRTGDGGDGLVGRAGTAGQIDFTDTVEMLGRLEIGLGRGGDAQGNGGAGTSIANASFLSINPAEFLPAQIVTTWRQSGDLGNSMPVFIDADPAKGIHGYVPRSIDFDDDGFHDAVFLSDVPDQIVVRQLESFDTRHFRSFPRDIP